MKKLFSMIYKSTITLLIIWALVSVGCRIGSGYSTDEPTSGNIMGSIHGKVTLSGLPANVRTGQPLQIQNGAEVWLEDLPGIAHQYTDASGSFVFQDIPMGNHIVVAKKRIGSQLFKSRSSQVSLKKVSEPVKIPDIALEPASKVLAGVIRDSRGNFLPSGSSLSLWGENFQVGLDGSFVSPPLPDSVTEAKIKVNIPGSYKQAEFFGPFISDTTPAFAEYTIKSPTDDNSAPSGTIYAVNNAGEKTIKCRANEQLYISLSEFDPDNTDSNRISKTWSTSNGNLSLESDAKEATWTAMKNPGVASVTVEFKDPDNATSKIHLRILVDVDSIDQIDSTGPVVTSMVPSPNSTSVEVDSNIEVVFNEELLRSSVKNDSIQLTADGKLINGQVDLQPDNKTIVWSPEKDLPPASQITISASKNIRDLTGNPSGKITSWQFSTSGSQEELKTYTGFVTSSYYEGGIYDYATTVQSSSSTDKSITDFIFAGLSPVVTGLIDETAKKIILIVPYGTDISALTPTITFTGVSVSPNTGVTTNYSSPVSYTVTALDGSTQVYTVTVAVSSSPSKAITSFVINGLSTPVNGQIDEAAKTISLVLPYGSNIYSLTPTIVHTGASISPGSGVARNFSSPVTYTVTSSNGETQDYIVSATVSGKRDKRMLSFAFDDLAPVQTGIVDETTRTVAITVPYGTDVTAIVPTIVHSGISVSPNSGVAQNFTNPVTYKVADSRGRTRRYVVTVSIGANPNCNITSFELSSFSPPLIGEIDTTAKTVTVSVPYGTVVTSLVPTITHNGTNLSPASGIAQNFTNPVTYTITAADGSTQNYSAIVEIASRRDKDISTFDFMGLTPPVYGVVNVGYRTVSLSVPYGTNVTNLVPTITHTGVSITPATGVAQNFTNPVTYTVRDSRGGTRNFTVTVTVEPNLAKEITSFSFDSLSPASTGIIDDNAKLIAITVPYGTNVTNLAPTITHTGASISPASGVARDFSNQVSYTVTAANGSTQAYTVIVTIEASPEKAITSFSFNGLSPAVNGVINETLKTINVIVPNGTNLSNLVPIVTHTGASISPASGVGANFSSPVNYTVTAENGTVQAYTVTVTAAPNTTKAISAFNFNSLSPAVIGTVNETTKTIALTVPYGTNVTSIAPTITHDGASVSPASGVSQNFSNPVTYTVTAEDGSTQNYLVTVTSLLNPAKAITTFNFNSLSPAVIGTINESAKTISLTVPYGTNITSIAPTIVHTGASVSPASGINSNFSSPVIYTVTAADASTQNYTVTVTVQASPEKQITAFNFNSLSPVVTGTINESAKTISLTVPYGTNITSIAPTIVHTGASVSPASSINNNFSSPVTYTVTAADGSTQNYVVTVTTLLNPAKAITSFTIGSLAISGVINETAGTISLTAPYGTSSINPLTPTISHTGASISPASGVAQDFSGPVTYTVTAENGTTKIYTVTTTIALNPTKEITGVTFSSFLPPVSLTIDNSAGTVNAVMPKGTDLTSLALDFEIDAATITPDPAIPQNFTTPVNYLVTAEDSTSKNFEVTAVIDSNPVDYVSPNIGPVKVVTGGTFKKDGDPTKTSFISSFRMSQYEVTQAQYMAITGAPNPSWNVAPNVATTNTNRPVEKVTWYDAIEFCNKLSIAEGLEPAYIITGRTPATGYPITNATVTRTGKNGYRLPTEAEWQWACMGASDSTSKLFAGSDGSNELKDYAWYFENAVDGLLPSDADYGTHPVGTKLPNEIGLYDMSGNVAEWCWDWYAPYSSGDETDPVGATTGTYKVVRGGSWINKLTTSDIGFRRYFYPGMKYDFYGIRVVRQ